MHMERTLSILSRPLAPSRLIDHPGVLPTGPPRAHASGPAPYRVLAIGGRTLAGSGVLDHDLALSGAIARGLARLVGHGFDVESIITERATVGAAAAAMEGRDLSKIDAIVLMLDQTEEMSDLPRMVERLGRLVDELCDRLTPASSITLVVPPPAVSLHSAAVMSALTAAVRTGTSALTRVVPLPERLDAQGPAESYATWGETIAATVAESLAGPLVWSDAVDRLDEVERQAAVERLGARDAEWETALRRFVTFAAKAYGTRYASIAVVDGDQARYVLRRGFDIETADRSRTICDLALRTYGGVIIGDAREDDRFTGFPGVVSGDVRFYAGYRIEAADGQPIGVLCVFDDEPRPVLTQDLGLLRDFALAAEHRIWELSRSAASSPGRTTG